MRGSTILPLEAVPVFLPGIHDLFSGIDGTFIRVIAQNKRRCRTGRRFQKDLERLTPQVSLLQAVSVERIDDETAQKLAPALWDPSASSSNGITATVSKSPVPRYRLAPHEEASDDGQWTRFICRFHAIDMDSPPTTTTRVVGETLSIYPFNYEYVSYRKGKSTLITPKGKDTGLFWTSNLNFQCPVPKLLQELVAKGDTVLSDGTATLFLDIIPIRTPPRYGMYQAYLSEDMIGPKSEWKIPKPEWPIDNEARSPQQQQQQQTIGFDPVLAWGPAHVLPRVEASGRWTNLPICHPPKQPPETETTTTTDTTMSWEAGNQKVDKHQPSTSVAIRQAREATIASAGDAGQVTSPRITKKPHLISICLWSSAAFYTRGKRRPVTDTTQRLLEWITFHLMVGVDHIYLYDNSGSHSNETSLEPIVDLFPASQVTRIEWPSIVCNNNIPAHDNTGERSSQYAAENSCLTRFGPFTEWMASIDSDEYLVPMGKHNSLRSVVQEADKKGYKILSFRSTRGRLRFDSSTESGISREMKPSLTFLNAYNCDSSGYPKPEWAERAKKQLYRTDFVLYHFVHYSTVTKGLIQTHKESGGRFQAVYHERKEHIVDEKREAVMVHTKTTTIIDTKNWISRCHYKFEKKWKGCYVGFPWPDGKENKKNNHDKDGFEYNCFINEKVETYWVPELKKALTRKQKSPMRL